jgi:hypothetical protein
LKPNRTLPQVQKLVLYQFNHCMMMKTLISSSIKQKADTDACQVSALLQG